jgi:branched-chain amino acid aminotransferase
MPQPDMRIFYDGEWHDGPINITGPHSHAFWLASSVFDGARAFEGVLPDIDRHCERLNQSALRLFLKPTMKAEAIVELAREGAKKFGAKAELYIKPMYWAERSDVSQVTPDPDSTAFCLHLFEAPLPQPVGGSVGLSPFRRPTLESMPTDVKTGALYPNNARALFDARKRGFTNCLVADMLGNIAETATSNIFMVKDGVVSTPAANGTFLNGVTRQRVIKLLRESGLTVLETTLVYRDFEKADEIFTSGNFGKVQPITRIDSRDLQPGPVFRRARELYWDFAHSRLKAAA